MELKPIKKVYELELQELKPEDEIQMSDNCKWSGYQFIYTAGHGYLVIPKHDQHFIKACALCEYGYIGQLAVYLEEDCEAPAFVDQINAKVAV